MKVFNQRNGTTLIVLVCVVVLCSFFLFDEIPQDKAYHNFSDTWSFMSVPNTLNVLSNIPFLIVGIGGLLSLRKIGDCSLKIAKSIKLSYFFVFLGTALVSLGSGYYHLWPSNETLVWDRIPMTIAFMGLYSVIIGEFISEKIGKLCLVPFLCLGISSVFYWWFTESRGFGDLRFYAVIQFFPILTIPVILVFFKSAFNCVWSYWFLLCTYIAAKVFETFDSQIHSYLGFISGHSIKHILPAIGLFILLRAYQKRAVTLQ